jgi:hypothetical protein
MSAWFMWGIPVLAAGLLLAAAVVFTNRWEISAVASSNGTALYILADRVESSSKWIPLRRSLR